MTSKFDRRSALKAGAALAAAGVVPAWAQAKPTIRFAALFKRSVFATEEPPNFCTIMLSVIVTLCKTNPTRSSSP